MELIENFIDNKKELELIKLINPNNKCEYNHKLIMRNSVIYYYKDEIPEQLQDIIMQIKRLYNQEIDSVQINEYMPKQKAIYHVDSNIYDNNIYILSLNSKANISFKIPNNPKIMTKTIELSPRSLFKFSDNYRYEWAHSIDGIEDLRYGIVFRHKLDKK